MNSINDLVATIENARFDDPDSSGDTSLRGCINLSSSGNTRYELFIVQQVLRSGSGIVLTVNNDQQEDFLSGNDVLRIDFNCGYFPSKILHVAPNVRLTTEILGCSAVYGQLDPIKLQDGIPGVYGLSSGYSLGSDDLVVESLAASVSVPDDEGDVRLEVRALVYNKTSFYIPQMQLKARAIGNGGREIDNQLTEEVLGPLERKVIELSFYSIKQNRLRDLSVAVELTAFKAVSHLEIEHEIST